MYNDFITQYLSEQAQGKDIPKPNPNNHVTISRKRNNGIVKRMAANMQTDEANAALELVKQRIPDLQRYVTEKGEQPQNDPLSLSIQAMGLRRADEQKVADTLGVTLQEASMYIDEAEARAIDIGGGADSFIGDIIGAVSNVANKALNKGIDNRKKKGKGTGFLSAVSSALAGAGLGGGTNDTGENLGKDITVEANKVLQSIKDAEKRKEINKMIPLAIIGVIVIILVTVLIAKNAKH